MEVIRFIDRHVYYERRHNRFRSTVFSVNDGEISVIDVDCIRQTGASICDYLEQRYSEMTRRPPAFWRVPVNELPDHAQVVPDPTPRDGCHCAIVGMGKKEARRFYKSHAGDFEGTYVCDGGQYRKMTSSDLPESDLAAL